ncbi:MAG: peptidoglycan DD-metalloendopeptidase family protein [Vicinamibacterales bacterium]
MSSSVGTPPVNLPDFGTARQDPLGTPQGTPRERVATLAQEFESMLMLQMIRQMRSSMLDEREEDEGFGNEAFTDNMDQEFARSMAHSGGLGLANFMRQAFERSVAGQGSSDRADAFAPSTMPRKASSSMSPLPVTPRQASDHASATATMSAALEGSDPGGGEVGMPGAGAVTSRYGWRSDPFDGQQRFHGGIDLRAVYGQDVAAAAPGRVTFAGERGGYGNLVIVEHPGGFETRYAHLSSVDVAVGQSVAAQEVVGRAGQTGRATAPHVHFEVLREGRRVDPAEGVAGLAAELKTLVDGDD